MSENNLWGFVLSFHRMDSTEWTQVVDLAAILFRSWAIKGPHCCWDWLLSIPGWLWTHHASKDDLEHLIFPSSIHHAELGLQIKPGLCMPGLCAHQQALCQLSSSSQLFCYILFIIYYLNLTHIHAKADLLLSCWEDRTQKYLLVSYKLPHTMVREGTRIILVFIRCELSCISLFNICWRLH